MREASWIGEVLWSPIRILGLAINYSSMFYQELWEKLGRLFTTQTYQPCGEWEQIQTQEGGYHFSICTGAPVSAPSLGIRAGVLLGLLVYHASTPHAQFSAFLAMCLDN